MCNCASILFNASQTLCLRKIDVDLGNFCEIMEDFLHRNYIKHNDSLSIRPYLDLSTKTMKFSFVVVIVKVSFFYLFASL